jgi:hypothetical protein
MPEFIGLTRMSSCFCRICNKRLRNPVSIKIGMGPVCRAIALYSGFRFSEGLFKKWRSGHCRKTESICSHEKFFETLNAAYDIKDRLKLLEREKYIQKEIRRAHNVYKMLMAGAFIMQPMGFPVPPLDHASIDALKRPIRGV